MNRLILTYKYPVTFAILTVLAWVTFRYVSQGGSQLLTFVIVTLLIWGSGTCVFIMQCMDAQHTTHVTYTFASHVIWCPKYRKKILVGKLATCIEQDICRLCEATTWTRGALSVYGDRVQRFLSAPASIAPSPIAHTLKGTTGRLVFQRFPDVKNHLWGGAF